MKKYLSLALALVMVLSLSTAAFAAENPESAETPVSYTGTGTENYSITVPSSMEPGDTAEVSVTGTWATNRRLVVTASNDVTMTNSIDGGEKVLDITFDGVEQSGDNTVEKTVTTNISMEDIENALFGTWSGSVKFSVSMEDIHYLSEVATVTSYDDVKGSASVSAPTGMSLVLRKYTYASESAAIDSYTSCEDTAMTETTTGNYSASFSVGGYIRCVVLDASEAYEGEVALCDGIKDSGPVIINFTIAGTAYQAEQGMTWAEWVNTSYNTGNWINKSGRINRKNSYVYVRIKDSSGSWNENLWSLNILATNYSTVNYELPAVPI